MKLVDCMMRHRYIVSLIAFFAVSVPQAFASSLQHDASPQKELLVINSYNESAPWVQKYLTTFLLEAAGNDRLQCNMVHMSGGLIRTDSLYAQVADGIFDRYRNRHPDYLVLVGRMAFTLMDRIKDEWGDIPVLLLGHNDRVVPGEKYLTGSSAFLNKEHVSLAELRDKYNFTFIEVPDLYRETIDMMVRMQPMMRKLVFASDEQAPNIEMERDIRNYLSVKYPDLEYERMVASELTRDDMQKYLMSEDLTVGLLLSTWYYARPGILGYPVLVVGDFRMIAASPHPTFSVKEPYMEAGSVGGVFADYEEIQKDCSSVLHMMLETGDVRHVPFSYSSKRIPMVNYMRLAASGISEDTCPDGTVFLHKPKSLWEIYSWQIVAAAILLAALVCIIILLMIHHHRRMGFMATHEKLVNNMPVCFLTCRIRRDADGRAVGIDFTAGNYKAGEMVADNAEDGDRNRLFDTAYILGLLDNVSQLKTSLRFTYYFAKTDSYYEFLVCQALNGDEVDFFGIDITARVKLEHSLKETSKTLEMTLNVAHIIPWKWDMKRHVIACEANNAISHIDIPKRSESTMFTHVIDEGEYFKRIHPDDRDRVRELYQGLLDGSKRYVRGEFRILSDNGGKESVDWMEVNASVLKYDARQQPEKLIGSLLLITARKEQEAKLVAAEKAAKESDRLKSAFLANMSHEIRTPLNAIVGFSNLLATTDDEAKRQKFVSIIENNNQLLLQLVGDILDLAKVEAGTLEFVYRPTDLNELIRSMKETMRMRVQPGVELGYVLGADTCYVETEPNRLQQVITNLLTNACKFTAKGSITFGYEIRGDELYFFVRDTGCGISKEGQARIFQRFAKLNSFVQGTGLGLSISQSIIGKMNGRIGVESQGEGAGSTFWFAIPYIPAVRTEAVGTEEVAKETINHEKVTILVAEDNESNFMLFDSILSPQYSLIHAWDGVEAVELFNEHNPQLVIMDINMPRMDGYEATNEIRKKSKTVPVIAVTAYAFASDKERIMKNGFNSYVSKPINAKRLSEEVKSALGSHFILL